MQGSKIVPGGIYAINQGNRLVRFQVDAVIQRRERNTGSPHDYSSAVEGFILEDRTEGQRPEVITLSTKRILGPYEEQAELKARKDAESAEAERKTKETEDNRAAVVAWLYKFTGLEPGKETEGYHRIPFRRDYSGIDINDAGVRALLAVINKDTPGSTASVEVGE